MLLVNCTGLQQIALLFYSARNVDGRKKPLVKVVSAQLIEVSDQTHAWAEEYDRSIEGLLGIQSAVATSVVPAIHATLRPAEK